MFYFSQMTLWLFVIYLHKMFYIKKNVRNKTKAVETESTVSAVGGVNFQDDFVPAYEPVAQWHLLLLYVVTPC
ncbi:MAG: hypothetical protein UZ14_CFX002001012 [Chloroflexi bacterium OLB14]|nr:MAG: hypothetical protein UZ14_CFX002001012 [Chloroflexi bacterium OLB14]